jgi:hypothetical protein
MLRLLNFVLLGISALTLLACEKSEANVIDKTPKSALEGQQTAVAIDSKNGLKTPARSIPTTASKPIFKEIEWTDLMPAEDLDALLNPPSYINDIEDGSLEDQISDQVQNPLATTSDIRYQQALVSTRIIPEMDGKAIRIPGFVVPLEFDDEQTITEFFLVPYFGACIHSPPPPPNQIIYVHAPEGLQLNTLYDPFWISGTIGTSLVKNYIATAAYSMQMHSYEFYSE